MERNAEGYREPARDVPVLGTWDVLVCGGGAAGCAAAVTAARRGARVLLAERYGFLGGATVSQFVGHILSTNGVDFQGVWHDWIRAVRARRVDAVCPLSGTAGKYFYRSGVDMEIVKHAWDDLLSAAGVEQLLHASVSAPLWDATGRVGGAVFDTRAGRRAVRALRVIDATGDGALAEAAGVSFAHGDGVNPWSQALTTVFRMGHVAWPEGDFSAADIQAARDRAAEGCRDGVYTSLLIASGRAVTYPMANWVHESVPPYRAEMNIFSSRVLRVDPLDPFDMTRAEREGRRQAWDVAEFVRETIPAYERSYLQDTGMHIGVRDTRRIAGREPVTAADAWSFRKRADSIARSSWDIDIWPADSYERPAVPRDESDYRERMRRLGEEGEFFDLPYRACVAEGVENLLVAGRCIGAEREAQASLRIQQTCQAIGEGAGLAAARSIEEKVAPHALDPFALAVELESMRQAVEPAFPVLRDIPVARRDVT